MRITNKMMTNNSLANINKNKNNLNKLDEQYTSGKKIQRPSDDPIIAVRALKLRTNLSELNQYYEKNIPDARAWLDVTESALTTVNGLLTNANTYCGQGANDTLTANDRKSIVQNLAEIKKEIYQQGDTNYAGRYVFTGYKTDSSLIFGETASDKKYTITENIDPSSMDRISYVEGSYSLNDYNPGIPNPNAFDKAPNLKECARIQLAYGNLDGNVPKEITYKYIDNAGVEQTATIPIKDLAYSSTDKAVPPIPGPAVPGPYDVEPATPPPPSPLPVPEAHFIKDTGELILPKSVYETLRTAKSISVTYDKSKFSAGDLKPEHYFDCDTIKLDDTGTQIVGTEIKYTKTDQSIEYEINFKQKLKVNTQGSDTIKHSIGRKIDEIEEAVKAVELVESNITEVKKLQADTNNSTQQKEALDKMLSQLEVEHVLKSTIMRKKFQNGITESTTQQKVLNIGIADLGSRYVRLDLTESRLGDQQVDFEDLLSTNEDADIAETIIKFNSAQQIYNASLSAASKVVKNTLLDFL